MSSFTRKRDKEIKRFLPAIQCASIFRDFRGWKIRCSDVWFSVISSNQQFQQWVYYVTLSAMSILRYPGVFGFYCPDVLDQVDHRSALAQTSAAPSATLAVLDQAPGRCRRSWRRSGWNFSSWNMLGILCPKLSLIIPNSSYVKRLQEITYWVWIL